VQALRGRITLDTQPGQGTRIMLGIPVTLAFLESMVVRSRQNLFAIPIEVVNEVFKPDEAEVVHIAADQSEMIRRQGSLVPIGRLHQFFKHAALLNLPAEDVPLSEQVIVVVENSRGRFGLPMDEIVGEQQVVMKPLPGQLRGIRGGGGCALLSSGEIAIALDVESLGQAVIGKYQTGQVKAYA
jgi:two-component system chemotaxis sensor kinase CheA